MANLYDILSDIERIGSGDPETGEIDIEALDKLELDFNTKVENIACFIKNLERESEALATEIKAFTERKKAKDHKAEQLENYLQNIMLYINRSKIETTKAVISLRHSNKVAINDGFIEWAKQNATDLIKQAEPTADKTAIKTAILNGRNIEFATLEQTNNINIK